MQASILLPATQPPRACRRVLAVAVPPHTAHGRHRSRSKLWRRVCAAADAACAPCRSAWRSVLTAQGAAKLIWATRTARQRHGALQPCLGSRSKHGTDPASALKGGGEVLRALRLAEAFQSGLGGAALLPAQARYALPSLSGDGAELTAWQLMQDMALARCAAVRAAIESARVCAPFLPRTASSRTARTQGARLAALPREHCGGAPAAGAAEPDSTAAVRAGCATAPG